MKFYVEESELLAFAIFAVVNYRKDDIESFNKGDYGLKIYHHEENRKDEYLIRIAHLDPDSLKEKDMFYIYQSDKTGWNYNVWKTTDIHEHPEWKGENLLKTVPNVFDHTRAKITAVLELQNWVYL